MEIAYIREFITLAHLENYMAAAEKLYISQPCLSKHIKSIETELGVTLFDRTTRNVRLNRYGKAFLPYAERIADANTESRALLSRLSKEVSDTVHLGVLPSFIAYGIPDHLVNFKRQHPDYSVTLTEGASDVLLRDLIEGRCTLAFVRHSEKCPAPQFVALPYIKDNLVLAIPRGHRLDDGRTSIRMDELEGLELMTSTSHSEAKMLNELSMRAGVKLNITNRLSRADSIIAMLKKDFGAALLMRAPTVFHYGDSVTVLDLEPQVCTTISLVYLKSKPMSVASRSFIQTVFPDGAGEMQSMDGHRYS